MTNESDGSYIPNPDHEQNKVNKWAYRWKVQNVSGNNEPLNLFSESESTCLDEEIASFGDENINSFGDKTGYPNNEYTESPDMSIGDYTYDLIGMITPPYGITLFVASSIAERSIIDVSKKLVLPLSMMLLVLILATYFPKIALYLPTTLLGYK